MRADSDHSRLCRIDDKDNKADMGWKTIPPLLQDMIIRAAAATDAAFPPKPSDSLLQILQSKKIITIRTMLNVLLASANCNVNIPVSLATTIASTNLRSISPRIPNPFSCLNTSYHDASQIRTETDISMQFMATDGVGIYKTMADLLLPKKTTRHPTPLISCTTS